MKYVVDELFLSLYKEIVDDYVSHYANCEYPYTEFCTCGLTEKIRKLRLLEKEHVKKYEKS